MRRSAFLKRFLAILFVGLQCPVTADDSSSSSTWLQFRGTHSNGHAGPIPLPLRWGGLLDAKLERCLLPGRGWSSPIVVGDSVWLTSFESVAIPDEQRGDRLTFDPEGPLYFQAHASVTCYALQVDLASRRVLNRIELLTVANPPQIHAFNGYATPTPASDGEIGVFHFGNLGTVAVELSSGKVLWRRQFAFDEITGPASSPTIFDSKVYFVCDGSDEQFVEAVDVRSGQTLWRTDRPRIEVRSDEFRRSFVSPIVIQHAEQKQLVAPTAHWAIAYELKTGVEIWRCRIADGYSLVPQPAFSHGLVMIATGFMKPELWAIDARGVGDVSQTHVRWRSRAQAPDIATPLVVESRLYTLTSQGVLSCLSIESGEIIWRKRLDGKYLSSPIMAGGKIYVVNQSGTTIVLEPGDEYREVARNETFGETQATPAVHDNTLILRTQPFLYFISPNDL